MASITTDNPKAWALLFQSRQAMDRMDMAEARRLAQEAVKEDSEFALAYHQLAVAAFWHEWKRYWNGPFGLKEVEAAEARANRLPEKERLTLRVFRALVDRRMSDAVQLSEQAVATYPLDKDILMQAGDVLVQWDARLGTAAQYFERALQLDPTNFHAIDRLLDTAWWTGQSARFLRSSSRAATTGRYDRDTARGQLDHRKHRRRASCRRGCASGCWQGAGSDRTPRPGFYRNPRHSRLERKSGTHTSLSGSHG